MALITKIPEDWPMSQTLRDNWEAYMLNYPTFGFPQKGMTFFVYSRARLYGFATVEDVVAGNVYGTVVLQPSANIEVTYKNVTFMPTLSGQVKLRDDADMPIKLYRENSFVVDFEVVPSDMLPDLVDQREITHKELLEIQAKTVQAIHDFLIEDEAAGVVNQEDCAELGCPRHPPKKKSANGDSPIIGQAKPSSGHMFSDVRDIEPTRIELERLRAEVHTEKVASDNNDDDYPSIHERCDAIVKKFYPNAKRVLGLDMVAYQVFDSPKALEAMLAICDENQPMILEYDFRCVDSQWRMYLRKEPEIDVLIRIVKKISPTAKYDPNLCNGHYFVKFFHAHELSQLLQTGYRHRLASFNLLEQTSESKWVLFYIYGQ